jgi:hypothetical protein
VTTTAATIPTTAATATSRTPDPEPLARLVGDVPRFLAQHLGRDAYRRRLDEGVAGELFDWARLNAALAEHRLSPPRLRLEMAGGDASRGVFHPRRTRRGRVLQDLDPAALTQRLRQGATLILDAAHELSPPLQRLCAGLGAQFLASCQANLYACWGATQGFDVHWDDHDVFVVQVKGRKRWALYGATREAPSHRDQHGLHRKPDVPNEEIVLEPGDMLYMPRGYWHAAVGMGEPTLHLTIGLTRKTGSDFLHWLANEALADPAVRTDLPLEQDDAALGAHIARVLAAALNEAPEALGACYRRHIQSTVAQRPKLSFPFIGSDEAYPPGLGIRLADGPCGLERQGSAVVLTHRGVRFTVAGELQAPLAVLAAGGAVTFAEVEAAAGQAGPLAAAFVGEMTRRGVFVLDAGA